MDKNHSWTVLKYTKPLQFRTTPVLKNGDRNMAVSMKAKKALVRRLAFPKLLPNLIELAITPYEIAYTKINEETVT